MAESIEDIISGVFDKTGRQWKVVNPEGHIDPSPADVKGVLDNAAKALYSESVGTTYNRGGLIVEKTNLGFDVYVHVGKYY